MNTKTTITIDWLKLAEAFGWLITALSLVPYSSGEIASLFPPAWKGSITIIFGTATVLTKVWRAIPGLPFNRPPGGAVGVAEIKPAALIDPPPCPVCAKRKKRTKK